MPNEHDVKLTPPSDSTIFTKSRYDLPMRCLAFTFRLETTSETCVELVSAALTTAVLLLCLQQLQNQLKNYNSSFHYICKSFMAFVTFLKSRRFDELRKRIQLHIQLILLDPGSSCTKHCNDDMVSWSKKFGQSEKGPCLTYLLSKSFKRHWILHIRRPVSIQFK